MVTGDQLKIAIETCRRLGLGSNILEGKDVSFEDGKISTALAHKVKGTTYQPCMLSKHFPNSGLNFWGILAGIFLLY